MSCFRTQGHAYRVRKKLFTLLDLALRSCLRVRFFYLFIANVIMTPTLVQSAWALALYTLVSFLPQWHL